MIEDYIHNEYGEPKDFAKFLYASQLLQGDAMRTAIESHRRNMPHCMGSLLWQHNDCRPVASWATRDYYGQWKAAHYMVRKAFEPLISSAIVKGDSLLALSIDDASGYWLDNNYFDVLPGAAVTCRMQTSLTPADVKERLKVNCLNSL